MENEKPGPLIEELIGFETEMLYKCKLAVLL